MYIESYRLLADSAAGIFCPAGKAWLRLWRDYPEFKLYSEDNFHPNYKGSLLAALVIYGSLMLKKYLHFVNYRRPNSFDLTSELFKILVRTAERTLAEKKR